MDSRDRSRVIHLAEAQGRIPGPPGQHFVNLLERGTIRVLLSLPVSPNRQTPHAQDEIYVIVRGRAFCFTVASGTRSERAISSSCPPAPSTGSRILPRTSRCGLSSTALPEARSRRSARCKGNGDLMAVDEVYSELLFSYGTLQLEAVQLATFGRQLAGTGDALRGFEVVSLRIEDPAVVAISGTAHHTMARFTGRASEVVSGTVFAVTPDEIQNADKYEVAAVKRVAVVLQSGVRAWVYVDARDAPSGS
jgi:hypothetical protein